MDNRINEIRRKISVLRLEMADIEASVRELGPASRGCTSARCTPSAVHNPTVLDADLARLSASYSVSPELEPPAVAGSADVIA
jgi:hypothetical protein